MCHHCDALSEQGVVAEHGSPVQKFVADRKKERKNVKYEVIKLLVTANPNLAKSSTTYSRSDFALAE